MAAATPCRVPRGLFEQRGLPDSRLTGDRNGAALPGQHADPVMQELRLALAAEQNTGEQNTGARPHHRPVPFTTDGTTLCARRAGRICQVTLKRTMTVRPPADVPCRPSRR
ncbi:hypothetical protein ABZV75_11085 [Streptomyces flaveolus]|uniref:hypothetical protein n=1 Tax=Streptomyces flaveolus TaxID=67297 RepID=UPI0033AC86A7